MKVFFRRFLQVLMVLCPIIWVIGGSLMLVNMGVIHIKPPTAPVDKNLIYNGEYIDLLNNQQVTLDDGDMRITLIDTQTGLPAASNLTVVDKNGEKVTSVNVVKFNYQGIPAMLRFTDNVVDGFTYQDSIFKFGGGIEDQWETNPDFLQAALRDYSSQVSTLNP